MKIKITEFAERHFDPKFGATKILNMTKEDVENIINSKVTDLDYNLARNPNGLEYKVMDGYAPFCKLVAVKNFTDARIGSMPITNENYIHIRSGYSARRDSELPVFSRWFDLPVSAPKADYLMFVLYSKEQIDAEAMVEYKKAFEEHYKNTGHDDLDEPTPFDAEWGVVAILGQSHPNEEPMKPETMLRNALGKEEGGSGVPLDRDAYMKSVNFWNENATVK